MNVCCSLKQLKDGDVFFVERKPEYLWMREDWSDGKVDYVTLGNDCTFGSWTFPLGNNTPVVVIHNTKTGKVIP